MLPNHMERTMRKLIAVLAGLLVMALAMPAEASWNIKQKDNGSTVWTDGSVEVPAGDSGLTVRMDDVSTAATVFVVSHKKGKIKKVYGVAHSTYTAGSNASVIDIGIADGTTSTFTPISAGATITMATTIQGKANSVSPADVNVNVNQGDVISIHTDGAATGTTAATFTIVIE